MERATAVNKLRKMLGQSFGYRVDKDAPTHNERVLVRIKLREARAEREAWCNKRDERRAAILAADEEYQRLAAAYEHASKRADELEGRSLRYKITVGTSGEFFFHVSAQGDSWEEIFAKLAHKVNLKS